MVSKKKLGEMLLEAGLIDNVQLQSALAHQKKWGMRLGAALIEMKFITERDLASFLERQLNTQCVSIMTKELSPDVINALTPDIAKKYHIFPLEDSEKELVIATSDPLDLQMLDELSFNVGKRVKPVLALESEISKAIAFYYDNIREEEPVFSMPVEEPVVDQIQMVVEKKEEGKEAGPPKKEVTTKQVVDALMTVLEKKGILTRSEVFAQLRKKP